jgi:hypothetical protein
VTLGPVRPRGMPHLENATSLKRMPPGQSNGPSDGPDAPGGHGRGFDHHGHRSDYPARRRGRCLRKYFGSQETRSQGHWHNRLKPARMPHPLWAPRIRASDRWSRTSRPPTPWTPPGCAGAERVIGSQLHFRTSYATEGLRACGRPWLDHSFGSDPAGRSCGRIRWAVIARTRRARRPAATPPVDSLGPLAPA